MDLSEALHDVLGRSSDFVGGIDNEALDFSQLEDFINDDNDASNTYFADTLAVNEAPRGPSATAVTLTATPPAILVQQDHTAKPTSYVLATHNLPESPPDSGSEPPYSPQDPAAHSPHGKSNGAPELLLNPLPLLHPLYPSPHQQPVLTPLLTQRALQQQELQPQQPQQTQLQVGLTCAAECPPGALVYTALQTSVAGGGKKRKHSQDGGQPVVRVIKTEPELSPDSSSNQTAALDDDYFDVGGGGSESGVYLDSSYQCIRFQPFQQTAWHALCDHNLTELPVPHYRVDADKGFNFSNADDAFVCQKKNHFQITCHAQLQGDAQFVKTAEGLLKVTSFHLHFYGVKVESPAQTIKVEQSQSDRSKKPFHPVLVDLAGEQVTKVTVGRLHFSETTSNNMRKKGKPNPDQRYFYLVVGLHAHCGDTQHFPVVSHASERIIVRASNPGQFESDVELCWQKAQTADSIFHVGRVGVNTDRPDEALVVHGNLKVTGHIVQPSDARVKHNIVELDSAKQLRNVARLRLVRYNYSRDFQRHASLTSMQDTGLLAQEVREVLPDAVSSTGELGLAGGKIQDFLVVNKERIFMENVGAVKELCKVTDNLETRIDELERMNRRLAGLRSSYSAGSGKMNGSVKGTYRGGKRHKEGGCSNKAIQITVAMLVLVMAFCLVAMAMLYFLEIGNKSGREPESVAFSRHHHNTMQTKRPTTISFNTTSTVNATTSNNSKGNSQPGSNILSHHGWFTRRTNIIKTTTQGLTAERASEAVNLDDSEPLLPASATRHNPPVLGRPKHCSASQYLDVAACQTYCCHGEEEPAVDTPTSDVNTVTRTSRQYSVTGSGGTAEESSTKRNKSKKAARRRRDADDWIDADNVYTNIDSSQDSDHTGLVLYVRGDSFNRSLGAEFCQPAAAEYSRCLERSAGNYSYQLPLSRYLPDETLALIFMFPRQSQWAQPCSPPAPALECDATNHLPDAAAPDTDATAAEGEGEWEEPSPGTVFTLEAGALARAAMRFRVPLLQTVTNICLLPSSKLGSEFLEYNFLFHRVCDE